MWGIRELWPAISSDYALEITFFGTCLGWVVVFVHWFTQYPNLVGKALGLSPRLSLKALLGYTALGVAGVLALGLAYGALQHTLKLPAPQHLLPPVAPLTLWIMGGVLAPILEEWVFRGAVLATAVRYTPTWVAVVSSSLLFMAMHLSYQAYPMVLVYVFLLGMWLGFLRSRSGSLWPSMLTHGLNNLLVLLTFNHAG